MKYVIYTSPEGLRLSTFAAPTTHADDAGMHPGWSPASAGYVQILGGGRVRCYGSSASLKLAPRSGDEPLIEALMAATLGINPPPGS
jgi:hypothetical protein